MDDTQNLVSTIQTMKDRGIFKSFIDYIRFPFYRNLEKNTKIDFDFPLTVFVGQNGCGKSSTLQALYGCPKGKSVGNFWFSTKVDPIGEDEERAALIYSYNDSSGTQCEVLKSRMKKGSNPDYWEPSRPLKKYDMVTPPDGGMDRYPAIEKEVLYLDFRSILSAFDKYFYYQKPLNLKSKTKQDYLRNRSSLLKSVIDDNIIKKVGSRKQNRIPTDFSTEELEIMSSILGKKYHKGKLIYHKFFKDWGNSIIFDTSELAYSEAFAGSGESAVAILVHEMLKVENDSLILLDEPEMSLHPGAQKKLKNFILEQIKKKHLQVVISTHSATLIEGLPSPAIKVFTQLPNGKFNVRNKSLPDEAFYYIGQSISSTKKIIVEDQLAMDIIKAVIDEIGEDCASIFDIEFYPGGHSIIKSDFIRVYSQDESNVFIIFDGDQYPTTYPLDTSEIPVG
ncbi:ATP-dependent nuclease [Methanohalophilus halophilus]|nr:AAA family ATPase [Methanohalophilus halophilus]